MASYDCSSYTNTDFVQFITYQIYSNIYCNYCRNVVHMEHVLLYFSGNKITTITAAIDDIRTISSFQCGLIPLLNSTSVRSEMYIFVGYKNEWWLSKSWILLIRVNLRKTVWQLWKHIVPSWWVTDRTSPASISDGLDRPVDWLGTDFIVWRVSR